MELPLPCSGDDDSDGGAEDDGNLVGSGDHSPSTHPHKAMETDAVLDATKVEVGLLDHRELDTDGEADEPPLSEESEEDDGEQVCNVCLGTNFTILMFYLILGSAAV